MRSPATARTAIDVGGDAGRLTARQKPDQRRRPDDPDAHGTRKRPESPGVGGRGALGTVAAKRNGDRAAARARPQTGAPGEPRPPLACIQMCAACRARAAIKAPAAPPRRRADFGALRAGRQLHDGRRPAGKFVRLRPATDLTRPFGRAAVVLYHFELQMAGIVLFTAMGAGAVSLWLKRRRERAADEERARAEAEERAREVEMGARADGGQESGQAGADDGPQPNK